MSIEEVKPEQRVISRGENSSSQSKQYAMPAQKPEPYILTTEEIISSMHVDLQHGLGQEQVLQQRKIYGSNELKAKKKINPFLIFLRQFKNFIIYILLFALALSALIGEYTDAIIIGAILILNAVIGFIQEFKAEKSLEALKKLSGLQAKVLRSGQIHFIETKDLVPGDIILLEEGSKIPADARLLEVIELHVSEASLTGESIPIEKHTDVLPIKTVLADRKNMVFSGTAIVSGRARAVVVAIGMQSEIGKIAGLLSEVQEPLTPLQKNLDSIGKRAGIFTLALCALVFIIGVAANGLLPILFSGQFLEFIRSAKTWFLTAISLAVAAVPEGLPAIVTIALALGVVKMLRKNALIRKLPSVETLGETTVICTDKTGTLTKNEMTVRLAYTNEKELEIQGAGYLPIGEIKVKSARGRLTQHDSLLFKIGVLCNNASLNIKDGSITGDPTEAALLVSAEKAGLRHVQLRQFWKRIKEIPFTSERKIMSTIHADPEAGRNYVFTKGAPERILAKCSHIFINGRVYRLTSKDKKELLKKNELFAQEALRMLGFAYKSYSKRQPLEENLIFVGLQGMIDPPHPEVPSSLQKCKEAGIRVLMITGDHQNTAQAIAKQIGIEGNSIEGSVFAALSEEQQLFALKKISIFARVDPEHKMIIVSLLQKQGEVVAMTGDGVNDAPAIKKADLGIAMCITWTDVSKEASDMVLQDDNFTTIVNAVEEGRGIYENIQKFVNYLFSCNVAEILIVLTAILLGWPLPLTAVMLLWLNLVTDGLPALALSVDQNSANLMRRPPKKATEQIVNKLFIKSTAFTSVLITIGVLGLFFWAMNYYSNLSSGQPEIFASRIQTIAFSALIVMELVRIQILRSEYKLGFFSNKYLLFALFSSLALTALIIYTPLNKLFNTAPLNEMDWLMIIAVNFIFFILSKGYTWIKMRNHSLPH